VGEPLKRSVIRSEILASRMTMTPSIQLSETIESLIDDYCAADGEVIVVPTEEVEEPRIELETRVRRMAIYRGSLKYPDLQPLVQLRSRGSVDCPHCEGHGRIDLPGIEPNTIVCYCGGLGWLEQEELLNEARG